MSFFELVQVGDIGNVATMEGREAEFPVVVRSDEAKSTAAL